MDKLIKTEQGLMKREDIVTMFSPMQMMKTHRHIKSIKDIVKTNTTSISGLVKTLDEDSILALIELHLWSLNQSMNLINKLTEGQIVEIAIEIVSNYYYLKMEDIYLIFRNAKMGKYGKLYSSLSMIDIFQWFEKYDTERTALYIESNTSHIHRDSSPRNSELDADAFHIAKLIIEQKKNT